MVQNFFFPSGFLVLVYDRNSQKYCFLHSVSDTGYPHCLFPGFGAFYCFSTFAAAKRVRVKILALRDNFNCWVVKIRPVSEVLADETNKDCMLLSTLDGSRFGYNDWFTDQVHQHIKTEFLINKIVAWPYE